MYISYIVYDYVINSNDNVLCKIVNRLQCK